MNPPRSKVIPDYFFVYVSIYLFSRIIYRIYRHYIHMNMRTLVDAKKYARNVRRRC